MVSRLKDVAKLLELSEAVNDHVRRISKELLDGSYQPRDFGLYLLLFPFYLTHRMTGQYEDVAALFEARTPLAPPESAALVYQIVSRLAGGQSGGHGEAEPSAVATAAHQDLPPVSQS